MKRKLNLEAKKFLENEERFLETFQKLHVLNSQRTAFISRDSRLEAFMMLPKLSIPPEFLKTIEEEVIPRDTQMKEKPPPKQKKPKALQDAERLAKEGASTPMNIPDNPDQSFRGDYNKQ